MANNSCLVQGLSLPLPAQVDPTPKATRPEANWRVDEGYYGTVALGNIDDDERRQTLLEFGKN